MSKISSVSNWDALTAALICEGSEAKAYLSMAAASRLSTGAQVEARVIAGGVVLQCQDERSTTLLNRAIGLGLQEELSEQLLSTLAAGYAAAHAPWSIELAPAAGSAHALALLKSARLRRGLATAVLAIECESAPLPLSRFRIQRVGPEWYEQAAQIEADVFRVSATVRSLLAVIPSCASFRQWLAFDREQPVAACLTHIAADHSWFGWCATLPSFQGQGIQSAVLAHCVADAAEQGCRWMTAETAVGTSDLPDRSYRNMLRFGFSEVYRRHSYIHIPRVAAVHAISPGVTSKG